MDMTFHWTIASRQPESGEKGILVTYVMGGEACQQT
jgi:hypothetical protein